MNDRQRIRLAALAAERLGAVAVALDGVADDGSTVLGRLRDAAGPLRGRSYEPTGRSGTGPSDLPSLRGDRALRDEADLDRSLEAAAKAINRIVGIVNAWPAPHAATADERRRLGLGDGPWCTSCARVPGADGQPRRESVFAGLSGEVLVVDGELVEAPALCQWCYRASKDWGRAPTLAEVSRHARGQRVAWPADVPRPKEATA